MPHGELEAQTPRKALLVRRTRRGFLQLVARGVAGAILGTSSTAVTASAARSLSSRASSPSPLSPALVSHGEFLSTVEDRAEGVFRARTLRDFSRLLWDTARSCVVTAQDGRTWVMPSLAYSYYLYTRDSFWILAALRDPVLSAAVLSRLRDDQRLHADGHIATSLCKDGARPDNRDHDDESTLMYILHCYLGAQMGVGVDQESLRQAARYAFRHVRRGRYVTEGEARAGPAFGGASQLGAYHYWADTYRPAGAERSTPEVITYNQGLFCVALRCLQKLGLALPTGVREEAERVYGQLVNLLDGAALSQREGSTVMDVSSLVGEALSLYLFDTPLLDSGRVFATISLLTGVRYQDGRFLGFKAISDLHGDYRPSEEFTSHDANYPGYYHNGGSWLLYDALALYAAARHRVPGAEALFVERLRSETSESWASHEFLSTHPETLGEALAYRDGYGWNSFVLNLVPATPLAGS